MGKRQNVNALLEALPMTGIRPCIIATIGELALYEPPAGQELPFVNPVALGSMIRQLDQGLSRPDAEPCILKAYEELRPKLRPCQRPVYYTNVSEECIDLPLAAEFLGRQGFIGKEAELYLGKVTDAICSTRICSSKVIGTGSAMKLSDLPKLPPPGAMMVRFDEIPETGRTQETFNNWWPDTLKDSFIKWRSDISSAAGVLSCMIWKRLYSKSGQIGKPERDRIHRWLALDYWCTFLPESRFVSYLCETAGFDNAGTLRKAFFVPESYDHPFQSEWPYESFVISKLRYDWPSKVSEKNVIGIYVADHYSKAMAEEIAMQKIGYEITLNGPKYVINDEWVAHICRNAVEFTVEDISIEIQPNMHDLYVISRDQSAMQSDQYLEKAIKNCLSANIKVHAYTPEQFDMMISDWPPSLTTDQPLKENNSSYQKMSNMGVFIEISTDERTAAFGVSSESRLIMDDWIKQKDEEAFDELMRTKTGNTDAMILLYKKTGLKKPWIGTTQNSYTACFRLLDNDTSVMSIKHVSGDVLEMEGQLTSCKDTEVLYYAQGYEFDGLMYWIDSEEGASDSFEDYEFKFSLDGGFGLFKYVTSKKTGCSLWINEYTMA